MKTFQFKYGEKGLGFSVPEEDILRIIEPNPLEKIERSEKEVVQDALMNPIDSPRLSALVKEGDTVCVVVPDITRVWQSPSVYVPPVIDELTLGGVRDEDITILSATGSHRRQSDEEYKALVSPEIFERIRVLDHVATEKNNLVQVGTTSFGTPVWLNKLAVEADHIVLTGGAILHFLAGYGGGRKYILPGIAGYDTIMINHSYALNEGLGAGSNTEVRSANMTKSNKIHMDMMEAVEMARPLFIMNVVNSNKKITHAFAGHYLKAHEAACEVVKRIDTVSIDEKADMVIASAQGFPKDMNFYQTTKTVFNAVEAVREKGAMIIVSECREGFGSKDTEYMITQFEDLVSREKDLRDTFSIGKFLGYRPIEIAESVHFILVSSMDPALFEKTKIHVVATIEEAIDLGKKLLGQDQPKITLMPYGANTLPML